MTVLAISDLTIQHRKTMIVQNIEMSVDEGDWFALVGESGSGKSVTAAAIGGLLPRELKAASGSILLDGKNLVNLKERELRKYRGTVISYIFQDYQGAFTPFMKIGAQLDEMLRTHTNHSKKERKERALHSLKLVELPEERVYNSYSFQLSGGQLQRAAIAMAMILEPKLLIADEPTTALDSMTAANILQLMADLKEKAGCAVFFITHDLRHVRKYANKVAIMRNGVIVESGMKSNVFHQPKHEYTKALFEAIPSLRKTSARLSSHL
ncbi:ABC transporter ATP-binding protein [Jeotgalibacillus soli]|uniref:Nickel ABC transporter ATPase n=1 Tax=Jeotgalibacillus soli TaxID=889306 RepID=A0A0C2VZB2_9BACL|nr:nickel ABC transporter ATPase [Jeotgalibacillus soli]